jgi:hypothetical protein
LFVVADDSSVYHAEVPLSALNGDSARLNWLRIEGKTAFPVAAVLSAPNVLDVFARASDGSIHWKRRKNSVWGRMQGGTFEASRWGWRRLGEVDVHLDRPVAVSPWPGRIDLFANNSGRGGSQPLVNTWDETRLSWSGFKFMSGTEEFIAPVTVAYQPDRNQYQVFGVDSKNRVKYLTWSLDVHRIFPPSGPEWKPLGGSMYDITAVASGGDRVTIIGRNTYNYVSIRHFEKGIWWTPELESAAKAAAGIMTKEQAEQLVKWAEAYRIEQMRLEFCRLPGLTIEQRAQFRCT